MTTTRRIASIAWWLTVVTGLVHLFMSGDSGQASGVGVLWFVGSGVAILLIGAVTLLAGLILGIWFGVATSWDAPQGPMLSLLFVSGAGATLLDIIRRRPAR